MPFAEDVVDSTATSAFTLRTNLAGSAATLTRSFRQAEHDAEVLAGLLGRGVGGADDLEALGLEGDLRDAPADGAEAEVDDLHLTRHL